MTKTAIVTGASRGLGRALAASLAIDRWHLAIDARSWQELQDAENYLASATTVTALRGDITDETHRRMLVDAAGPTLDLLVLNAGTLGPSPLPRLADYPVDALRDVFEINTVAQLRLTQLALPSLRAAGGRLLAITSDAAVSGYEGWGGYGASKAALEQLTKVIGVEEPWLRAYAVDPGDLRTRMHQDAFPGEDISDRPEPESAVPALRRLIDGDLPSGRYEAAVLGVPA